MLSFLGLGPRAIAIVSCEVKRHDREETRHRLAVVVDGNGLERHVGFIMRLGHNEA